MMMPRRLAAVAAVLAVAASPALADFTIQGPITFDSGVFNHSGARVSWVPGTVPGTFTKVTVDAFGRVTLGATVNCADLSDGGTACPADVGTIGHTLGFLDENKTDSGTNDFTGENTFTGVYGRGREVTSSDVLTAADCGRSVVSTGGSTIVLTTFASGAPAGKLCAIAVIQQGAGEVQFAAGGGTTISNPIGCTKAFGQGAIASLAVWGGSPNAWYLGGSCLP